MMELILLLNPVQSCWVETCGEQHAVRIGLKGHEMATLRARTSEGMFPFSAAPAEPASQRPAKSREIVKTKKALKTS